VSASTPRSIALGVVAYAAGLDSYQAALVSLHDDISTVAAAAPKLMAIDTTSCFALVAELSAQLQERARDAAIPRAPSELPSVSAPTLEVQSLTHVNEERRLFAT
jgi:urease accessory protein